MDRGGYLNKKVATEMRNDYNLFSFIRRTK